MFWKSSRSQARESIDYSLVPVGIPIPVFLLGLFTSGIQALVFPTLAAAYLGECMEVLGSVGNT